MHLRTAPDLRGLAFPPLRDAVPTTPTGVASLSPVVGPSSGLPWVAEPQQMFLPPLHPALRDGGEGWGGEVPISRTREQWADASRASICPSQGWTAAAKLPIIRVKP
jgi:hypothetical protein